MSEMSSIESELIACHECDVLHRVRLLEHGDAAKCTRCGATLYQQKRDVLDRTITLALTGLVLFVLANAFPFMTFEMEGRDQTNTLISGTIEFWNGDYWGLAILVFLTSIMIPLSSLLALLYVLLPIKLGYTPWQFTHAFRFVETVRPWAMMEVYLLGVIVAIVKLTDFATIELGTALYCFSALIIVTAAANAAMDPRIVWEKLEAVQ